MSTVVSNRLSREEYERAAAEFADQFTLEDLMESTPHSRQKRIAEESFLELRRRVPRVRVFQELLVQYRSGDRPVQVVPDLFVILSEADQPGRSSYILEYEPEPLFLVMEVLSPNTKMKDNKDSFRKYERHLQVPYCILVDPQAAELKMHHWEDGRYRKAAVAGGRHLIPELDLSVGLQDGVARFWHRGELLRDAEESSELVSKREAELVELNVELAQRNAKLVQRDSELAQRDADLALALKSHQKLIRRMATAAGRADILIGLAQADLKQLVAWEAELDDE